MLGIKAQLQVGEGAEFEALADYRQGMDRRAIDWKQSARHTASDRQGISHRAQQQYRHGARCRPGDVASRSAACRGSTAPSPPPCSPPIVALKDGDRVGLFAFDSQAARVEQADRRRRAPSPTAAAGRRRDRLFGQRDQLHARPRDAGGGPQPPLADRRLHRIRRHDQRRADAGRGRHAAEAPPRPVRRAASDEELEAFAAAEPVEPDDVSRAVTAAGAAARAAAGADPAAPSRRPRHRGARRPRPGRRWSTPISTSSGRSLL